MEMWNYAALSQMAKAAGSPEKLVELILKHGIDIGKKKAAWWIPVAVLGGAATTLLVQNIKKHLDEKQKQSEKEFEKAKAELIQGIRDYDDIHPEES